MIEDTLTPKIQPERPIKQFLDDVIASLTEPKRFFTERYPQITLNQALLFAVVLNWLATFLEWMTRMVRHETLLDGFKQVREQLDTIPVWKGITPHLFSDTETISVIPAWTMELASVALNPFKTLFTLAIGAIFIWLGASLLIPKKENQDPIDYTHFLKLLALASSGPKVVAAILGFLPLGLGTFIGVIYVFCLEIQGISIRYQVSKLRSFAVLILPSFVFFMIAACLIGAIAGVLFGIFGALFH